MSASPQRHRLEQCREQHRRLLKGGVKESGSPWWCLVVQGISLRAEVAELRENWVSWVKKAPRREKTENREPALPIALQLAGICAVKRATLVGK